MDLNKTVKDYNDEESARRLVPVIYLGLLLIVGVAGNVLVLVVYPLRFPNTTHKVFIIGLAISDLLVCAIVIPFEIFDMRMPYMFYNEIACKVFRTCSAWFSFSSMFTLMELSWDTYKRICYPLNIQITVKQAKLYICLAFIVAMLIASPNLLGSGTRLVKLDNYTTGYDCSRADEYADTLLPVIGQGSILLICLVCIIGLVVIYSLIGRKILNQSQFRKQFQIKQNQNENIDTNDRNKAEIRTVSQDVQNSNSSETTKVKTSTLRRVTKIAFVVSLVFVLSYIPNVVISLLTAIKGSFLLEPGPVVSATIPTLLRFVMINNIANPLIYGFMDRRFRQNCKNMCNILTRR